MFFNSKTENLTSILDTNVGVDVNAITRRDGTALDAAQRLGHSDVIALLTAAGI